MKENNKKYLLIGAILSVFPLLRFIADCLYTTNGKNFSLIVAMVVNLVFSAFVVVLAVVQMKMNCKKRCKRIVSIVGIAVSGLCIISTLFTGLSVLPQYVIVSYLGLISTAIALFIENFVILGMIGHILLLIGYVKSLPKRK